MVAGEEGIEHPKDSIISFQDVIRETNEPPANHKVSNTYSSQLYEMQKSDSDEVYQTSLPMLNSNAQVMNEEFYSQLQKDKLHFSSMLHTNLSSIRSRQSRISSTLDQHKNDLLNISSTYIENNDINLNKMNQKSAKKLQERLKSLKSEFGVSKKELKSRTHESLVMLKGYSQKLSSNHLRILFSKKVRQMNECIKQKRLDTFNSSFLEDVTVGVQ